MVKNCAFVFIKPHAVTDKVKELVKETLAGKDIEVKKEGSIEAVDIDKNMLIDKHYYAIAAKATLKKPSELPVPKDKFKDFFGVELDEALKDGKVFNAKDACEELGVDAAKLDELWAAAKKAPCNTGDNGVHASASPFEALAERMNWPRSGATTLSGLRP
mmetsp:Transcript_33561/g.76412  ORF Transcript_33561/g.76412 Transcript_33561/m.76412 type:complete len:160 (-) Transcript_33561:9-488(-)